MEIKISCPHCNQHIQCDEGYRGMQIACPGCRLEIGIPAAHQTATLTTKELEAQVENSIRETLKPKGILVKTFQLVHLSGVKYRGALTAMTAQGMENCNVNVTYDGADFIWQIEDGKNAQASNPLGWFLFSVFALFIAIAFAIGYMPYNNKITLAINLTGVCLALANFVKCLFELVSKR